MNSANKLGRLSGYFAFIQTKIISLNRIFFWKDSTNFRPWKMTLKLRILRSLTRLFIILVSLTRSLFSEKMLISNRCISGLMPNLIKKSWIVFSRAPPVKSWRQPPGCCICLEILYEYLKWTQLLTPYLKINGRSLHLFCHMEEMRIIYEIYAEKYYENINEKLILNVKIRNQSNKYI